MPGGYEIPSLTGQRVALRPFEAEEEALAQRWALESDLLTLTCRPPIQRSLRSAVETRIRRQESPTRGTFAIVLRGTGTPIGQVRYFDLNFRNRSVELGYLMAPGERGKGYAQEAISLLLGYLFDGLGMNKVYAQTASFNTQSVKLLDSIGFQRDAVLREHHFLEGKLHDEFIYSILAREWRDRRV